MVFNLNQYCLENNFVLHHSNDIIKKIDISFYSVEMIHLFMYIYLLTYLFDF